MTDPNTINAVFGILVILAGAAVILATMRRTWISQTISELKNLAEAQAHRIDFLEEQLQLMTDQNSLIKTKFGDMESDQRSLVRRNRELEERQHREERP